MKPPVYFKDVRRKAGKIWSQLEQEEELAAPWKHLFRQVQSPRHVLSELLQNADDAGVTMASATLEDGVFTFEHNGKDFFAEQFESLCRFGFSNKRSLHTIGFRGIGFKSTFSLGDTVEVYSPTLAVRFHRERFTEPEWIAGAEVGANTRIQIQITDRNRAQELRKNFKEWTESPSSLLFFTHLHDLRIQGRHMAKQTHGPGPVPHSERLSLSEAGWKNLIVMRSGLEKLPADVLAEIRAERDVAELHLPPCRVEIVLGLPGTQRLFVVLPTGATVPLPFSCNAPFIQDPARYAIKDPATSPTNRWLLQRAGKLAGENLHAWLSNTELTLEERAAAYALLYGDIPHDTDALSESCANEIIAGFDAGINPYPPLLATTGEVLDINKCFAVPRRLHDVWEPEQLTKIFGEEETHVLAAGVLSRAQGILQQWGWLKAWDEADVIARLGTAPPPTKPSSWAQLDALWQFVQKNSDGDWSGEKRRGLAIVPVEGKDELHTAAQVIRLSTRRDQIRAEDWDFLTGFALAISNDWLAWLAQSAAHPREPDVVDPAFQLLHGLSLHEPSPVDRIAARASERIFSGETVLIKDCVHAAHVFAALGARAPEGFKFVTSDDWLRFVSEEIVADDTGLVGNLTPEAWANAHLLHAMYTENFGACKPEQWDKWVRSEASGLHTFVPVSRVTSALYSRPEVERLAIERGASKPEEYHYKRDSFTLRDHTFDPAVRQHWRTAATSDSTIWARVMAALLAAPVHHWTARTEAELEHDGIRYTKALDCGLLPAQWIAHFRTVPCLFDLHGTPRLPAELLLRTPDTEPLLNIESFVRADLDTPAVRPLLKLLGVRDTPADSTKILSRLGSLARQKDATLFLGDIIRFYEALDRVVSRCAPAALKSLQEKFASEALILSESLEWFTVGEVTIFSDPELGVTGLHPAVRTLPMWPRLGVSERPAAEKTLLWLQSLPSGGKLDAAAQRRVRPALQRDSLQVWQVCGHWLSLDATWEPVGRLKYRQTMQQLTKWGELSPAVRGTVADLRMLNAEAVLLPPFVDLSNLADAVEFRVVRSVPTAGGAPAWFAVLGESLCRIQLGSDEETRRIRLVAQRLYRTEWKAVGQLEVVPYIEGAPSGEPSSPRAFWQERRLYIAAGRSAAHLHKELAEELSRPFSHPEIAAAIGACLDRDPEYVRDYLDEQFRFDLTLPLPGLEPVADSPEAAAPRPGKTGGAASDPEPSPAGDLPAAGESDDEDVPTAEVETPPAGTPPAADTTKRPPVLFQPRVVTTPLPALIDRYAASRGFRWSPAASAYVHPLTDGRLVEDEFPFHWVERTREDDTVRRLWLADCELSRGLEVAAELWLAVKEFPATTALVVLADDRSLCVLTGADCVEMQRENMLELFPARYRLVVQS